MDGWAVVTPRSQKSEPAAHAILTLQPRANLTLRPPVGMGRTPSQDDTPG
jgi:hypothetical protein